MNTRNSMRHIDKTKNWYEILLQFIKRGKMIVAAIITALKRGRTIVAAIITALKRGNIKVLNYIIG